MTFRLFVLITGCVAVLLATSSKKSKDLEGLAPGDTIQVVVQYRNLTGLDLLNSLVDKGGKIVDTETRLVGGTSPTLSSSAAWGNCSPSGDSAV